MLGRTRCLILFLHQILCTSYTKYTIYSVSKFKLTGLRNTRKHVENGLKSDETAYFSKRKIIFQNISSSESPEILAQEPGRNTTASNSATGTGRPNRYPCQA